MKKCSDASALSRRLFSLQSKLHSSLSSRYHRLQARCFGSKPSFLRQRCVEVSLQRVYPHLFSRRSFAITSLPITHSGFYHEPLSLCHRRSERQARPSLHVAAPLVRDKGRAVGVLDGLLTQIPLPDPYTLDIKTALSRWNVTHGLKEGVRCWNPRHRCSDCRMSCSCQCEAASDLIVKACADCRLGTQEHRRLCLPWTSLA